MSDPPVRPPRPESKTCSYNKLIDALDDPHSAGSRSSQEVRLRSFSFQQHNSHPDTKTRKSVVRMMDNFEYFSRGAEHVGERNQQKISADSETRPDQMNSKSSHSKMATFLSLRDLPVARSSSPSPPPPPRSINKHKTPDDQDYQDDLPPPPSYSTLKRLSTYRR